MCGLRICHESPQHETLAGHVFTDAEALTAEQADRIIQENDPLLFAFIQVMRRIEGMREGN